MKRTLLYILLCLLLGTMLSGCKGKETKKSELAEQKMANATNTEYYNRNTDAIGKHFEELHRKYDNLDESEAFVVHTGYVVGLEYWETFLKKVNQKEKCSIDIVLFDNSGEPIFQYLEYSGTEFFQYLYLTGSDEDSEGRIQTGVYSYFKCVEVPKEEYEFDFSITEAKPMEVIISNEKLDTYEEYVECLNSEETRDEDIGLGFSYWTSDRTEYDRIVEIIKATQK